MAIISTGLAKAQLDAGSMTTNLTGVVMKIYSAPTTVPATADDAIPGDSVLLTTITGPAAETLEFEASAVLNTLEKLSTQVWNGTNAATGTAAFFRFAMVADAGASSTTAIRMQGSVGVAGKDLNLSSVSLTSGAVQTIDYYAITQPTA